MQHLPFCLVLLLQQLTALVQSQEQRIESLHREKQELHAQVSTFEASMQPLQVSSTCSHHHRHDHHHLSWMLRFVGSCWIVNE